MLAGRFDWGRGPGRRPASLHCCGNPGPGGSRLVTAQGSRLMTGDMRRSTPGTAAGVRRCRSGAAGVISRRSVAPGRCRLRQRSHAPTGLARSPVGNRARRFGRDRRRPLRKPRACSSERAVPAHGTAFPGSSGGGRPGSTGPARHRSRPSAGGQRSVSTPFRQKGVYYSQ